MYNLHCVHLVNCACMYIHVILHTSSVFVVFYSSYLHCKWATVERLLEGDKRVEGKVKRYKAKQQAMGIFANVSHNYYIQSSHWYVAMVYCVCTCML